MKSLNKILSVLAVSSMAILGACTQDSPITDPVKPKPTPIERGTFAKGADVSWITQLEKEGNKFFNSKNVETECMQLLRDECGVNSIRLRVWVNPAEGWNNIDDVVVKARRANALGMRLMIDFHYSDTWADPGAQVTPASWADMNITDLCKAVSNHTKEMLEKLQKLGIEPEWVQVGNETRAGMLYPHGAASNGKNYADLVNAGYDAVKSVFANAQVIIHLDSGDRLSLYSYLFDILKDNGGKYDIIGMSLYPEPNTWSSMVASCIENINIISKKYGKPVMICEVGMSYNEAEICKEFISALMMKSKTETAGMCKGIFYWEPEAPAEYNGGYNKGCFVNGKPTVALDAFKN